MATHALGIQISNATLQYIDGTSPTLSQFSMTIPKAKWTCLLGRSGCGKTTLLRYLAGLLDENVHWQGELLISDGNTLHQRIAYMAQQDLLLPWLNVLDNACLSQKFGVSSTGDNTVNTLSPLNTLNALANSKERATLLLKQVGLADYVDAFPAQLSGGMRQRVALVRTLMQDKPVVLMDEPFSALDAVTRYKLQTLAANLLKDKTVVFITHDPQEAIRLADNLYVLQGSPASAQSLTLPKTIPPRLIDGEYATLQQTILEQLEQDYE